MTRSLLASATLIALVALSGCSSNDDASPEATGGDAGETSMEASGDRLLSSEPGGDTRAIAGFWNASPTGPEAVSDSRFVLIAENGLETGYELQQDDIDGSNCYSRAGPQTLTPGADDRYDLDDGIAFTAVRGDDGSTLTVTLLDAAGEPDLVETWTLVEGRMADDLPLCDNNEEEDASPAGGENVLPGENVEPGPDDSGPGTTSMFNPDLPPSPPSPEPSGNDTAAIAGLWIADVGSGERADLRRVGISDDGLWTDYDFRQDAFGTEGNCYLITPLRLDLETGDAASGTYSIADGRTFSVSDDGDADTLTLTFVGDDEADGGTTVSWPRDTGNAAENLNACE